MYEYLSSLYPKKMRENIFAQFNYFDLRIRREFVVGSILFFSVGISLALALQTARFLFPTYPPLFALIAVWIGYSIFIQVLVYTIISVMASTRAEFIEHILPDCLQLVAANLRAGMTIERALISANRKEFGYFNELLTIVGKEISTGKEVGDALLDMTKHVKSEKFLKSMQLIVMAFKSGGELSRLLSEVAENLVHQRTVEEKIKNNVTTYLIFIGAAVAFAAPMLYGLSSVIVKVIVNTFSGIQMPAGGGGTANMPLANLNINPEMANFLPPFVNLYAQVCLITLSLFASFLLGLIQKGKAKYGISYILPITIGALVMYNLVSFGANALFSGLDQ